MTTNNPHFKCGVCKERISQTIDLVMRSGLPYHRECYKKKFRECQDCIVGVIDGKGASFLTSSEEGKAIDEMNFSYCPICGRKLD